VNSHSESFCEINKKIAAGQQETQSVKQNRVSSRNSVFFWRNIRRDLPNFAIFYNIKAGG
jgi:hypothetical protein